MQANDLLFSNVEEKEPRITKSFDNAWKLLIIDDEPSIHDVTELALDGFEFEGRSLNFLHAYNSHEAMELLNQHKDIAVALVDVVMESEHAGLDLVDKIRNELNNSIIRLVLRTGQPGQAPERSVIKKYDINDYKEKTELTSQKLYSVVYTSIRSYRDLYALDANRKGLERVIKSSTEVYKVQKLSELINGILEQLVAMLYLDKDTLYVNFDSIAIEGNKSDSRILAGTGRFTELTDRDPFHSLDKNTLKLLERSLETKKMCNEGNLYSIYFSPEEDINDVLIFSSQQELSEDNMHLLELFCNNLGVAYKNLLLHQEVEDTQREILYMLGEAVETRSKETGSHVRRVAEYSSLLAKYIGLSETEIDTILMAAPLHDFGKIGIPDNILHKPDKLESDEWSVMQTHAELGETMLQCSERKIFKAASIIAGQHHEKWDGSGYPKGLAGSDIHIYARITALADVYDALGSKRCYKDPWPHEKILQLIKDESGKHFDPELVKLLCDNLTEVEQVRIKFPD